MLIIKYNKLKYIILYILIIEKILFPKNKILGYEIYYNMDYNTKWYTVYCGKFINIKNKINFIYFLY
jgi:hypothetical protein